LGLALGEELDALFEADLVDVADGDDLAEAGGENAGAIVVVGDATEADLADAEAGVGGGGSAQAGGDDEGQGDGGAEGGAEVAAGDAGGAGGKAVAGGDEGQGGGGRGI